MTSVGQIVFGPPVAAMNKKHHWMRALACRNSHINKLIRILPVRNPQIGFRWFLGEDRFALHGSSISSKSTALQSLRRNRNSSSESNLMALISYIFALADYSGRPLLLFEILIHNQMRSSGWKDLESL